MILVFVLYALFASVFTIAKEALNYSSPVFLVGSRMLVAGLCMIFFQCCFRNKSALKLNKEQCIFVGLLAFFNIYVTNVLELWGLQYMTSFKTCFLYSLSPFITALVSYFALKERLTMRKWVGLVIGFAGFIPILLLQTSQEQIAGELGVFSLPELALIGAVLSSVFGWIILKKLVFHQSCSFLVANGYSMAIGGLFALVHSFWTEVWNPIPVSNGIRFLEWSFLLIIVSNALAYNLYGWLLKKFSPTFMSFSGLSTPLFTAFFGWLYFGEQPGFVFFLSLLIVFFGLFLFYGEELKEIRFLKTTKPEYTKEEPPPLL